MLGELFNLTLDDTGKLFSLQVKDGIITQLEAQPAYKSVNFRDWNEDGSQLNGDGKVLLPGLTEAHAHIDKNFSPVSNTDGTLRGAIDAMATYKSSRDLPTVVTSAHRAIRQAIKHGVTRFRSHIDLGCEQDLYLIQQLCGLKAHYQNVIEIELTALGETETHEGCSLMQRATALGVDYIGGAPALCPCPERAIDNAVELALQTAKGLDLHIDETESITSNTLEYLAEKCLAYRFPLPVYASHCCSLGFQDSLTQARVAKKLRAAKIQIITLPSCNLVLMGRDQHPVPRGIPPIKCLLENHVRVHVGSDNVQDPFNPFGNYDPLMAAHFLGHTAQLTTPDELLLCQAMSYQWQHSESPFSVGAPANFTLLDSQDYRETLCSPPPRLATIYRGRCVYRARITETWSDELCNS